MLNECRGVDTGDKFGDTVGDDDPSDFIKVGNLGDSGDPGVEIVGVGGMVNSGGSVVDKM